MYEETKSSIDWKGLFLKIVIVFLIVFIAIKGFSMLKSNNTENKQNNQPNNTEISDSKSSATFTSNMEKLRTAGKTYFENEKNKDKLPTKTGYSTIITLNELINEGYVTTLLDDEGNKCDGESSYVTATLDGNNTKIKANLVCGNASTYSTVYLGSNTTSSNSSNSSTTTSNKTTSSNKTTNSTSSTSTNKTTSTSNSTTTSKDSTTTTCTKNCTPVVNVNVNASQNVTINGATTENAPKKVYYKVSFDSNGGYTSYKTQTVEEKGLATNPGTNSKYGCTFKGWYLNGSKYDFNTPVTKNMTLIAYYTCNDLETEKNDENLKTGTHDSVVYTMGWAEKGTEQIEISHVLRLPEELEDLDIEKVRIANIEIGGPINTTTLSEEYENLHDETYFYKTNNWESGKLSKSYLATIDEDDVGFAYSSSRKYKTLKSALNNGFKVTWYADDVKKQCSKTFSVNNATNLCNYGIFYIVTWEYTYYE